MVKLFNVVAVVVRSYQAAFDAAIDVIRAEGGVTVEFIREAKQAYGKSRLPAALKDFEASQYAANENAPAWAAELDTELKTLLPGMYNSEES